MALFVLALLCISAIEISSNTCRTFMASFADVSKYLTSPSFLPKVWAHVQVQAHTKLHLNLSVKNNAKMQQLEHCNNKTYLSFFNRDCTSIFKILLITHNQHLNFVMWVLIHVLEPLVNIFKSFTTRNVKYHNYGMSTTVISCCNTSITLLTCRILLST